MLLDKLRIKKSSKAFRDIAKKFNKLLLILERTEGGNGVEVKVTESKISVSLSSFLIPTEFTICVNGTPMKVKIPATKPYV